MRFTAVYFRPIFGRVLSVIVCLIAAAGIVGFAVTGDWSGLVRYGWGLVLLAAVAVALYWLPSLRVEEHEVTVRNVFSTVHIPWPAIQRIDTKWALSLHTTQGTVDAWASPAPNRYASQSATRASARIAHEGSGFFPRPGDLLETESGAAAHVIRRRWDDLRESGMLDAGAEPGSVRRNIHWRTIAVLGVLVIATALGYAL